MAKMIDHTRISTVIISTLNKSCSCIFKVYFVFLKIISYTNCSIIFFNCCVLSTAMSWLSSHTQCYAHSGIKSVENFLLKMDPSHGKKKKRNEKRVKSTTQGKFLCKQSVKEVWFLCPANTTICNSVLTFPQLF